MSKNQRQSSEFDSDFGGKTQARKPKQNKRRRQDESHFFDGGNRHAFKALKRQQLDRDIEEEGEDLAVA